MAAGEEDVVTLDVTTGSELGLSEADLTLLTETGLLRDAGGYFCTDIPDGPLGLFAVLPLNEDNRALILGGTGPDGENTQSHDDAFDTRGDLVDELHLGWAGDREEIAAALSETGLAVKPPGDEGTTFILAPADRRS
ncbi:hypothetical protein [Actinomadura mexicana]|uniref:Uncharacterized protein n=1 Tax=Actinomadura mexicana TaxID=134959 RepID=A0A238VXR4_9ACTN|nr:hypothetical protein [Actinomadura mexicana]SNR38924.1 hypothetical protein SAMN06265355_102494 [Actinomadura mexicana]